MHMLSGFESSVRHIDSVLKFNLKAVLKHLVHAPLLLCHAPLIWSIWIAVPVRKYFLGMEVDFFFQPHPIIVFKVARRGHLLQLLPDLSLELVNFSSSLVHFLLSLLYHTEAVVVLSFKASLLSILIDAFIFFEFIGNGLNFMEGI